MRPLRWGWPFFSDGGPAGFLHAGIGVELDPEKNTLTVRSWGSTMVSWVAWGWQGLTSDVLILGYRLLVQKQGIYSPESFQIAWWLVIFQTQYIRHEHFVFGSFYPQLDHILILHEIEPRFRLHSSSASWQCEKTFEHLKRCIPWTPPLKKVISHGHFWLPRSEVAQQISRKRWQRRRSVTFFLRSPSDHGFQYWHGLMTWMIWVLPF